MVTYLTLALFSPFRFGIDELRRFVLTVKKNYRDVPYHNWTHAFAVAHSMYLVIRSGNDKFTALEVWDLKKHFMVKMIRTKSREREGEKKIVKYYALERK